MSTQRPIECNWRLFDMTEYRLETSLSSAEQVALASSYSRSGMLRMDPVPELIRPLTDIAAASGCGRKITRLVIARLLREMHVTGLPCWCWPQERWQTLCREVRDGRPLMATFAGILLICMIRSACPISENRHFMPLPSLARLFITRNCNG